MMDLGIATYRPTRANMLSRYWAGADTSHGSLLMRGLINMIPTRVISPGDTPTEQDVDYGENLLRQQIAMWMNFHQTSPPPSPAVYGMCGITHLEAYVPPDGRAFAAA